MSSLQAYLRTALELLSRSSMHALWHGNSLIESFVSQIQAFEILEIISRIWRSIVGYRNQEILEGIIRRSFWSCPYLMVLVVILEFFISESRYVEMWKW